MELNKSTPKVVAELVAEFLEVAFHCILYTRNLYPSGAFQRWRKYNVPVQICFHAEVRKYIEMVVERILIMLQSNEVEKIVFSILNKDNKAVEQFVFDVEISQQINYSIDTCLKDIELAFRAFCLKINTSTGILDGDHEDGTFAIQVHTKKGVSAKSTEKKDFDDQNFPWVETEKCQSSVVNGTIIPLKTADTSLLKMQLYAVQ